MEAGQGSSRLQRPDHSRPAHKPHPDETWRLMVKLEKSGLGFEWVRQSMFDDNLKKRKLQKVHTRILM